ncbi:DUF4352 domain-containing protein, partial [Actinospica durhamensis]
VGLGLLAACGSSSAYAPPTATGTAAHASGAGAGAGMGQTVSDGNYSFVVDSSQCGISSFTDVLGTSRPTQAQFCAVVVTMTNRTNSPQNVPPYPTMIDRTGNMYNTTGDGKAEVAAEQDYFGSDYQAQLQVNPGSHYQDVFVYDVPQGVQAASVQLHGQFASAGVSVTLKTTQVTAAPGNGAPAPVPAPTTSSPTTSSPPSTGAAQAVVQQYFAAINAGDYAQAWALGGQNIEHGSYSAFVQGFATTSSDSVHVVSVSGDTVTVTLDATQTDGSVQHYAGTYTVHDGVIVGADLH